MSTVLVLGLGESGLAMARWVARGGGTVRVWDSRAEPPRAGELREHVPNAEIVQGALGHAALAGVAREPARHRQARRAEPEDECGRRHQRSFRLASPTRQSSIVMIQKRTTTCVSFQPDFSK